MVYFWTSMLLFVSLWWDYPVSDVGLLLTVMYVIIKGLVKSMELRSRLNALGSTRGSKRRRWYLSFEKFYQSTRHHRRHHLSSSINHDNHNRGIWYTITTNLLRHCTICSAGIEGYYSNRKYLFQMAHSVKIYVVSHSNMIAHGVFHFVESESIIFGAYLFRKICTWALASDRGYLGHG